MLLGDPDIEGAIRKRLAENIKAGAGGHRRRDRNNAIVFRRFLHQAFAKHFGVGRRVGFRLDLRAGGNVEGNNTVILVG
jgi:hypothetical protein